MNELLAFEKVDRPFEKQRAVRKNVLIQVTHNKLNFSIFGSPLASKNCSKRRNTISIKGRGGGQVVSMITIFSDDPSSNPAEA